uniref:Uncharacterized protein n=1 Tax=Glossina brevipalpis TaxID=37001 RepID=A0A1A9WTS8_9MUSC
MPKMTKEEPKSDVTESDISFLPECMFTIVMKPIDLTSGRGLFKTTMYVKNVAKKIYDAENKLTQLRSHIASNSVRKVVQNKKVLLTYLQHIID